MHPSVQAFSLSDNSACLQELSDLESCQESEVFDWELFVADLLTFEDENSLDWVDSFNETNYAHLHRQPLLSSTKLGEDGTVQHPPSASASAHNNSKEKTMIFDNNLLSFADDLTWFLNRR